MVETLFANSVSFYHKVLYGVKRHKTKTHCMQISSLLNTYL